MAARARLASALEAEPRSFGRIPPLCIRRATRSWAVPHPMSADL